MKIARECPLSLTSLQPLGLTGDGSSSSGKKRRRKLCYRVERNQLPSKERETFFYGGFTNTKPDISFFDFLKPFLEVPQLPCSPCSCEGSGGGDLGGEARVPGILLSLEALADPAPGQPPGEPAHCWTDWEPGRRVGVRSQLSQDTQTCSDQHGLPKRYKPVSPGKQSSAC